MGSARPTSPRMMSRARVVIGVLMGPLARQLLMPALIAILAVVHRRSGHPDWARPWLGTLQLPRASPPLLRFA